MAHRFAPGHHVITARRRQQLTLAKRIGGGGEGDVFTLVERPDTLAKIYHKTVDGVLDAKLTHLTSRYIPALKAVAAWPEDRIFHPRGGTVGFLMPAVTDAKPLHELMTPKVRRKEFPSASFNQLVEVALAVSKAIDAFHQEDLVVGDINGRNILVRSSGSVCLIDIDSIQIGDGSQFPCTVGFPDYTPPELQGLKLTDNRRNKDSDRFGLSVVVFQLLAMGRHPFDGSRLPRETAIKRHVSAFAWVPFFRTRPLALNGLRTEDLFDKRIAELFGHAFALSARFTGRPTAAEWADALADYQTHLNACTANSAHQYPMTLRQCPWCELERKGKPPAFAATTVRYTHWTQHYEGMMRLLLGRFAPIVLPSAYRAFLRVLPRRAWMGLGAAGLILALRACGPSLLPPNAAPKKLEIAPIVVVPPLKTEDRPGTTKHPAREQPWDRMTIGDFKKTLQREKREKSRGSRGSRKLPEPAQDLPQQN
jgi:DNA-binding helix-hairpin-helix protein with protein kinase domain